MYRSLLSRCVVGMGLSLAIFAVCVPTLQAGNVYFDNAGAASNWNVPGNWDPAALPGVGDTAILGSSITGEAAVDVLINTNVGTVDHVRLADNLATAGTLEITTGGTLTVTDTVHVGDGGSPAPGILRLSGGSLNAANVDVGSQDVGTLELNGSNLAGLTNFYLSGAGSSITRAGSETIAAANLTTTTNATYNLVSGDSFSNKVFIQSDSTIDISTLTLTSPTIQFGTSSTAGNLSRTTGTLNTTFLDIVGGSSITTAAGDVISTQLTVRNNGILTLGADVTTQNVDITTGATLNMTGFDIGSVGTPITSFEFVNADSVLNRTGSDNIHANGLNVEANATFAIDITGPDVDTVGSLLHVHTDGILDIGSGTLSLPTAELRFGEGSGSAGHISRTAGGLINVDDLRVQGASTFELLPGDTIDDTIIVAHGGVIDQNADTTVTSGGSLLVSGGSFGGGTYNIQAGRTLSTNSITVGGNDAFDLSVLNLGSAAGTAVLSGSTGSGSLTVQESGELNGWGTTTMAGTLGNFGRIVANGFGTGASDLDLSSFTTVNSGSPTRDNLVGEDHGWYAVNKGRLIMPDVTVGVGSDVDVRVGESASDTDDIDMINSMEFSFANVGAGGPLSVDILATDHDDVQPQLFNALAVFEISTDTISFDEFDLTIRYDDILAAQLSLVESDLKLLHHDGDDWFDITSSVNTTDKFITALGVTSLSQFAIAAEFVNPLPVPEPNTSLLLLSGLGGMFLRRRKERDCSSALAQQSKKS